jgi:hypothetical protein
MSEAMERRYRSALDWYPRRWRDANGEAMMGTLLDEAEATGRERPRLADLVNLARYGLSERLAVLLASVPAGVRDRASALALGSGFAFSLVMFVGAEWAPWAPNSPRNGWASDWPDVMPVPGFGPFASGGAVLYTLWIAAFVVSVTGFPRAASLVLVWTLPVSLVLAFPTPYNRFTMMAPPEGAMLVLAMFAVVAVLGSPTRAGRRRRGAAWMLAASGVSTVIIGANILVSSLQPVSWFYDAFIDRLDPRMPWVSMLLTTTLALIALATLAMWAHRRRNPGWVMATVLVGAPWLLVFFAAGREVSPDGLLMLVLVGLPVAAAVAYVVMLRSGYRVVLERAKS